MPSFTGCLRRVIPGIFRIGTGGVVSGDTACCDDNADVVLCCSSRPGRANTRVFPGGDASTTFLVLL